MYKINQTAAFFLQISFIQVSLSLLFLGDRFFFRNINWSTCSGLSRLRLEETISPAVLNTRSDATLVAGIQRYFLARDDSQWQVLLLFPPLQWVFLQGQQITHSVPLDFFVGLVSYRSSSHPHFKVFSQQLVQRWHFLLFERRVIIWNRKQLPYITGFVCHDSVALFFYLSLPFYIWTFIWCSEWIYIGTLVHISKSCIIIIIIILFFFACRLSHYIESVVVC